MKAILLNWQKNWKTTSMGLSALIGAIVHIIFLLRRATPVTEAEVVLAVGGILAGVGFLVAGDSSQSADKGELKEVQKQIEQVPHAINSGDTTFLEKSIAEPKKEETKP